MKRALIFGAGGFIGSHMVKRLEQEGYFVCGVDLKYPEFDKTHADEFHIHDLRYRNGFYESVIMGSLISSIIWDEIYQFAADMGGAGFVFTGDNDADIMCNSALINLNLLESMRSRIKINSKWKRTKIFYSSSACIYPQENQLDPDNPNCRESSAYPANPDSEYGWEKLFSERMYKAFERNYGLNVRIARYHNIFGPFGSWNDGREKAPAAFCRKIAEVKDGDTIEMWGDGQQTRSFLYIDECIEGTRRLMNSDCKEIVNIGSEEMVSINELVEMICKIADKNVIIRHVDGPLGVRGRNSQNDLLYERLNWKPTETLKDGLEKTYRWIENEVNKNGKGNTEKNI